MASNMRTPHFVEELVAEFKCNICTGLLESPVLTECCGQHFCHMCLEKWLVMSHRCPHCRSIQCVKILDKPLARKIRELKVYCKYKENGCTKIFQYFELEKHETQCTFDIVTCPKCNKKTLKKALENHLSQRCNYRIVRCQLCNKEGEYWYITESHIERECPEVVISCRNKCGTSFTREDKDSHKEVCLMELVSCPFSEAGCNVRIVRKDLDNHLATSLQQHVSLNLTSHLQLKKAHEELRVKHSELQGKYDMVLSSVADKLQSRRSPQEQLADIGECIQPFLHVLTSGPPVEGSKTVTLQFSEIGCKPLKSLQATNLKWIAATPPFYIDGYPGCKIYIAYYPLTVAMELLEPGGAFPPEIVTNQLELRFDEYTRTSDDFLPWKNYVLLGGKRFRLSKYKHQNPYSSLTDLLKATVVISMH